MSLKVDAWLAKFDPNDDTRRRTIGDILGHHDEVLYHLHATISDQKKLIGMMEEKERMYRQIISSLEKQVHAQDTGTDSDIILYGKEVERLSMLVSKRESDLEKLREIAAEEMMILGKRIDKLENGNFTNYQLPRIFTKILSYV